MLSTGSRFGVKSFETPSKNECNEFVITRFGELAKMAIAGGVAEIGVRSKGGGSKLGFPPRKTTLSSQLRALSGD